jgi:two-component system chemotaxis response regulator CheY/response regulator NasT
MRALIVDDTADIRFMVGFQLKMEGLAFEEADSGEAALARCAGEQFDLVVLDFRMPGLNGLEVAQRLLNDNYPAQLVIYSAYLDEELQAGARDIGIPAIDKSDNDRLLEVVRGMVAATPA